MNGGYDEGYQACPCFWGTHPGSLVAKLCDEIPHLEELQVFDAGCGEGKNAAFLAARGARVLACDVSAHALANASRHWSDVVGVEFQLADVTEMCFHPDSFDIVVAYGLFHCLPSVDVVRRTIAALQQATRKGGYHVLCAFNERSQDLRAHPGFSPLLLDHKEYVSLYAGWQIVIATDSDLHESHPHNGIPHRHSLTRILAKRV